LVLDDRAKELEVELATLATDMWAAQKRLEEKGFGSTAATNHQLGGG
jgi:hypothetical protein